MKRVLIAVSFPPELLAKIQGVSPDIEVEQVAFSERKWPDGFSTEAEIYYAAGVMPPLELVPNLRWIQMHWAGINSLRDTAVWDSNILLTTASGVHAPNMAQYTLAQMLAWAHHVPRWLAYQQKGEWPKNRWDKFLPDELHGRTLGILGYGSLGREIARLVKPFGMKILVTKRDARHLRDEGYTIPGTGDPQGELPDRVYPSEATRSMLKECDYVVITLPLTSQTQHLINRDILKEMKPNAYLINIGRGSIVNEADLVHALKKGWIAGAGLDVFEAEPLPADSPLWRMENVILTPHVSGFTPHYDERAVDIFVENLRRYLSGKPLLNLVNREWEY